MEAANNYKSKQEKELSKISPLIRKLGYTPSLHMCGDRPDICLPSFKFKEIGIEVTEYAERYYSKDEYDKEVRGNLRLKVQNDIEKNLDSYIEYFDNREKDKRYYPKESKYRISIWFVGGMLPFHNNLKAYKDDIFKEIDNFIFPSNAFINNKFIADVRLEYLPNASKSVIDYQRGYVECMLCIDNDIMSEIIKEKNEKLLKYKECKSNEELKEYWLAICLPNQVQDVTEKYRVPLHTQTDYDKIFFVQDDRAWQIK